MRLVRASVRSKRRPDEPRRRYSAAGAAKGGKGPPRPAAPTDKANGASGSAFSAAGLSDSAEGRRLPPPPAGRLPLAESAPLAPSGARAPDSAEERRLQSAPAGTAQRRTGQLPPNEGVHRAPQRACPGPGRRFIGIGVSRYEIFLGGGDYGSKGDDFTIGTVGRARRQAPPARASELNQLATATRTTASSWASLGDWTAHCAVPACRQTAAAATQITPPAPPRLRSNRRGGEASSTGSLGGWASSPDSALRAGGFLSEDRIAG